MSNNTFIFHQISEIPKKIWDELDCSSNVYFSSEYLDAVEKNNDHLTFFYVVLTDTKQKAIAFASVQIITFHLDAIENDLSTISEKSNLSSQKIQNSS